MQCRSIQTMAVLLLGAACVDPSGEPAQFTGRSMGTTYAVKVAAVPAGVDAEELWAEVDRIIQSVDERMSTYAPGSELSRFNACASTDWFPVTVDTLAVVAEAQRVSQRSGGAFDLTVGPLVDLWGFGPAGPVGVVPTDEDLATVRESVGYRLLETRASPPALRKRLPRLTLDLSGIAKGFAVDAVARHFDEAGVRGYLIELGGELRARGRNAAGQPWRVAIERPSGTGRSVQRVVLLEDRAMATSGDYRNYFERDGRRFTHVIDPRTGRPVEHGVASVTVMAETAMRADAFATALMVLAPGEALDLAEELGLSVHLVVRAGDGLFEFESTGFDERVLR